MVYVNWQKVTIRRSKNLKEVWSTKLAFFHRKHLTEISTVNGLTDQ